MKKTLVVNMNYVDIEGDILDLSCDDSGIIYSISKEIEEEISVDYVDENTRGKLKGCKYDACTFFFSLNSMWRKRQKISNIKEVKNYLKDGGKIYLWDVNKERGKKINNKVEIILPNGKIKGGVLRNNNILTKCNYEEILNILEKYYIIEDSKVWEEMFFIKAKYKNNIRKE